MQRIGLSLINGFSIFTFVALSFLVVRADAAQVKAVKGKKVLMDMQTDNLKVGDILKVEDPSGKAVGLVKLTKTKGTLAEGIFKGKVEKGWTAKLRPPSEANHAKTRRRDDKKGSTQTHSSYGALFGYNSAKASIKLPNSGSKVSLSGSGLSLKAFMDYPLFSWLGFRGMAGLEQFKVGGVTNAECGTECKAEINYLAFDFWGRATFGQGKFRPWAGAGFDLMFPISKTTTALDKKSITNTSLIAIGGGLDWVLTEHSTVPIQIEYDLYPSSQEVTANALALRIGYGRNF